MIFTPQMFGAKGDGEPSSAQAILDALKTIPTGGTLFFPKGRYVSPGFWERSDIRYIGEKMPRYRSDYSGLEDGSVINGASIMSGDRIVVEGLGFDHGPEVADTIGYAPSGDALVIHDRDLRVFRTDISARNVIGISRDISTPWHAILFEGLQNSSFDNIHGCHSYFPIVVKAFNSTVRGLSAIRAGDTGIYFKSDSYAPCHSLIVSNISYDDQGMGAGTGICFLAAEDVMEDISVSGIRVHGGKQGLKVVGADRAGWQRPVLRGCQFSEILCEGQSEQQIYCIGALDNVSFKDFILGPTDFEHTVLVNDDALDVVFKRGTSLVGRSSTANFHMAGGVRLYDVVIREAENASNTGGITIVADSAHPYEAENLTANLTVATQAA